MLFASECNADTYDFMYVFLFCVYSQVPDEPIRSLATLRIYAFIQFAKLAGLSIYLNSQRPFFFSLQVTT